MNRGQEIYVGVGANLPSPRCGSPLATCRAALRALDAAGVRVERRSRWYRTVPVPISRQPLFVNGVVRVSFRGSPMALLATLHHVEAAFGRRRGVTGAPRVLDLDLLAYGQKVTARGGGIGGLVLPHPRLHDRAFVLRPLAELAPEWRHPLTGSTVLALLAALPPEQIAEPIGRP